METQKNKKYGVIREYTYYTDESAWNKTTHIPSSQKWEDVMLCYDKVAQDMISSYDDFDGPDELPTLDITTDAVNDLPRARVDTPWFRDECYIALIEEDEAKTLKPCPYCGGEAVIRSGIFYGNVVHSVECKNCRASTLIDDSEQLARQSWNGGVVEK